MTFASASQFHIHLPWGQRLFSVLNVKVAVAAFNQEKALVGAFSVILQLHRLIDLRHYPWLLSRHFAPEIGNILWLSGMCPHEEEIRSKHITTFYICESKMIAGSKDSFGTKLWGGIVETAN